MGCEVTTELQEQYLALASVLRTASFGGLFTTATPGLEDQLQALLLTPPSVLSALLAKEQGASPPSAVTAPPPAAAGKGKPPPAAPIPTVDFWSFSPIHRAWITRGVVLGRWYPHFPLLIPAHSPPYLTHPYLLFLIHLPSPPHLTFLYFPLPISPSFINTSPLGMVGLDVIPPTTTTAAARPVSGTKKGAAAGAGASPAGGAPTGHPPPPPPGAFIGGLCLTEGHHATSVQQKRQMHLRKREK